MFSLGCAVFEDRAGPKPVGLPQEKVFHGSFDDVWRAMQLALQGPTSYPLRINNMDTGVIETEQVKGSMVWSPPNVEQPSGGGYSYRLIMRVIKGAVSGRQAYKVTVQKVSQIQRDFFAEPEPISSDGLEEKVILYRVDREMQIDRALRRLNKKQNQGG
ncbi:MAG: hypothetical protein AB7N80_10645 [Bdellovibrionales bacterium]